MGEMAAQEIVFSPDGSSVEFRPHLPGRGGGRAMIFVSTLGLSLLTWALLAGNNDQAPGRAAEMRRFYGLGAAASLGILIASVYLATRRQRVVLTVHEVLRERGWAFRRAEDRWSLSDFAGLRRSTMLVNRDPGAGETIARFLGVATLRYVKTRFGERIDETFPLHCLSLVPKEEGQKEIPLAGDRRPEAITALMKELSQRFALNVVTPTLDGFVALPPGELDRPASERPAPAGPRGESIPPRRLKEIRSGATTTIRLPRRAKPLCLGVLFGGPMLAIAATGFAQHVGLHVLLFPLAIGAGALGAGLARYRRRPQLELGPLGIRFEAAVGNQREHVFVSWRDVRHVAAAKRGRTGRPSLLVTTPTEEHWLAARLSEAEARWLAEAVLAEARKFRPPPETTDPGEPA